MNAHLWEINHPYYCSDGNYFSNDCSFKFESWEAFFVECGDYDLDLNLVFRWDWSEHTEDSEDEDQEPATPKEVDPNERNGVLQLSVMHQRKGRYVVFLVKVCRADEPQVIEYLRPRFERLKALWSPFE